MIALALGWYLLAAPFAQALPIDQVRTDAPLSEWHMLRAFDTAWQCEAARRRWADSMLTDLKAIVADRSDPALGKTALVNMAALPDMILCVASDDPRLK